MNLKSQIKDEIIALAKQCMVRRVLLFGSRARGDNLPRSDIDLAVLGGNVVDFRTSIDERVRTLLMFDVVDLGASMPDALRKNIERDGIEIYAES